MEIVDAGESGAPHFLMTLRDASSEGVGFEKISGTIRSTTLDGASVETQLTDETLAELFPELAYRRVPVWNISQLTGTGELNAAVSDELAKAWRERASEVAKSPTAFRGRGDVSYYFYADAGQEARWSLQQRKIGSYPPKEVEVSITSPTGESTQLETIAPDLKPKEYEYTAAEAGWYRIDASFGASSLTLSERNLPIFTLASPSLDVFGTTGRFEFYVPSGSGDLGLRIVGSATERVTATLRDPDGQEVATLKDVSALGTWSTPVDDSGTPQPPKPGFWTLELQRPTVGVLEDYIVTILGVPALLR